jgi:SAM-dependent methyltransferase
MAEFTGERVVPGEVNPDLWNEHRSRYLFAARLSRGKRVLDIGCGTGYGASELAKTASRVVALDFSQEAVGFASIHYRAPNLTWLRAQAGSVPLPDATFDLIVAFEIIEHLSEPDSLVDEAARLLAKGGQFIVSTPNRSFYAESRRDSGPNPFHEREYEYDEFQEILGKRFSAVSIFVQNHGPSITFEPVEPATGAEVRVESEGANPGEANFFVAVCAATPLIGSPAFVHVPSAANLLRERSEHIQLLEDELKTKDRWLEQTRQEHRKLVDEFRQLQGNLEESNRWAERLNADLDAARAEIDRLNKEISERAVSFEAKITELEKENDERTRWAVDSRAELDKKVEELSGCVDALHRTEKLLEERTAWAQDLDRRSKDLEARMRLVEGSRWVRIGKTLGMGPKLRQE